LHHAYLTQAAAGVPTRLDTPRLEEGNSKRKRGDERSEEGDFYEEEDRNADVFEEGAKNLEHDFGPRPSGNKKGTKETNKQRKKKKKETTPSEDDPTAGVIHQIFSSGAGGLPDWTKEQHRDFCYKKFDTADLHLVQRFIDEGSPDFPPDAARAHAHAKNWILQKGAAEVAAESDSDSEEDGEEEGVCIPIHTLTKDPNWIEAAVPPGTPVDCYTRLTAKMWSQLGAKGRVAWAREQRDKQRVKHVHACIHEDMHDES
jgi:hypothetical protein